MHNFITSLFNVDKEKIKNIHIVFSNELSELHITLIPEKLSCPYCHGITYIHGYSRPKSISHPKLTDRKCVNIFKNYRYRPHVLKHLLDSFRYIRLNIMYQLEYNSDSYYLLKTWKDLIEKNASLYNKLVYNFRFKKKLHKRQLQKIIMTFDSMLYDLYTRWDFWKQYT